MDSNVRLFVDTNVAIDYAIRRKGHAREAIALFGLASQGRVRLAAAAMTFPFTYYIARGASGLHVAADTAVGDLRARCAVVAMDAALVDAARVNPIDDLEDAVQYECALRFGAEAIITRDQKDFAAGTLPAYSAAEWLTLNLPNS